MRVSGRFLFKQPELREALLAASAKPLRAAVFDALLANPRSSKLRLRRAALEVAVVDPLILRDPAPAILSRKPWGSAPFEMTCAIPFTGAAWLFDWSVPVWPLPRQVKAEIRGAELLLAANAWHGDETWLPAVLAGEAQEIERIVAGQAMLVDCHNRELPGRLKALVERIHPRISQQALRTLHDTMLRPSDDGALALGVTQENVKRVQARLWREWTR